MAPLGAQNIGWKFYIVWTCTNALFLPILFFLYPETGQYFVFLLARLSSSPSHIHAADRTLEDLDAYYRSNPPLVVTTDKNATSRNRPALFVEMQEEDVQKAARQLEQALHIEDIQETTIS